MDTLVYETRIRGYRSNKHEQENFFRHQICEEEIREENKKVMREKGGPNETLESKLDQLELHERIHRLTENRMLSKKIIALFT